MIRLSADRARCALLRALHPHAAPFTLIAAASTDWASNLFEGARHRLAIALDGPDRRTRADRLESTLTEIDLPIQDGFVADIAVMARLEGARPEDGPGGERPVLAIEALTIADGETVSRAVRRFG